MNQLDDASHSEKAKKAGETKKSLPTRDEPKRPEEAQAGDLEKLCSNVRLEKADVAMFACCFIR